MRQMNEEKTMTANRPQETADDWKVILELKIDAAGEVTRKDVKRPDTLEGKLLGRIYPGIRVARITVPEYLSAYEQSEVEERMKQLVFEKTTYKLAGVSGSAKDARFYFVEQAHAKAIAKRFQMWPQAMITYFSILMSDCKAVIEEPDLKIAVVKDGVLGTNDCRGWIRKSIYRKLNLKLNWFCQFRLGFNASDPRQAKGGLKTISDRAADLLGVDIILPESSCKPGLKDPIRFLPKLKTSGRLYSGPAILGIKQWSRQSEFGSSSSLVENASEEAFEDEILSRGIDNIRSMTKAFEEGDYQGLLEQLGHAEIPSLDTSFDPDQFGGDDASKTVEWDPVDAVLLADKSGSAIKFPYVLNQLDRRFGRWGFRTCTSAGFKLPSFALVDDGVLIEHKGKIFAGSDWIPKDVSINPLESEESLCVRYPIRWGKDLLRVRHIRSEELIPLLKQALGCDDLPDQIVTYILDHQLRMEGAYILHSKTAKRNGGDFDFDTICAVPSDLFPKFVAGQPKIEEEDKVQEKTKTLKPPALWWNLERVAMNARGNGRYSIGSITDLKTSCVAAGRMDFADVLVGEQQNALDGLKWDVEVNRGKIDAIRNEVDPAPWLQYKRVGRVSDLPKHLEIADTDKIGRLYNTLRKELGDVFKSKRDIEDFRGLFSGQKVAKEMFEECQLVNSIYGDVVHQIIEEEEPFKTAYEAAQAHCNEMRKSDDKELRNAAFEARRKTQEALWAFEEDAKVRFQHIHLFLRYWAQGKQEKRQAWAQAMNSVVSNGTGSGAVFFHTFPQEIVDTFAAMTGGDSMPVRMPQMVDGRVWFDDLKRAFLVQPIENPDGQVGEMRTFLFKYGGDRKLFFEDTSLPTISENS
jgi:hypothetical protein